MAEATIAPQSTNQNELFRILGTVVVAASFFFASWWMARSGWLDAAAMFLTMFVIGFGKDRLERGLIKTPDMLGVKVPDTPKEMTGSFKNVRWFALSLYQGAEEWRDKSPNLRPLLWCAGVAALYVAAKFAVVQVLVVATNPAMIVLVGGTIIGVFIAPGYFGGLIKRFKAERSAPTSSESGEQA